MQTQAAVITTTKSDVLCQAFIFMFAALCTYVLLIQPALATPMGAVICKVAGFIYNGNLGRGLATMAIIIVGIGATLGKVSWGLAITVAVGISVIFNANTLAATLVVGGGGCP